MRGHQFPKPAISATSLSAMTSRKERIEMVLDKVKHDRLCLSCWAQVLVDGGYLDVLLASTNHNMHTTKETYNAPATVFPICITRSQHVPVSRAPQTSGLNWLIVKSILPSQVIQWQVAHGVLRLQV